MDHWIRKGSRVELQTLWTHKSVPLYIVFWEKLLNILSSPFARKEFPLIVFFWNSAWANSQGSYSLSFHTNCAYRKPRVHMLRDKRLHMKTICLHMNTMPHIRTLWHERNMCTHANFYKNVYSNQNWCNVKNRRVGNWIRHLSQNRSCGRGGKSEDKAFRIQFIRIMFWSNNGLSHED